MRALPTDALSVALLAILVGFGSVACRPEPEAGSSQGEVEAQEVVEAEFTADSVQAGMLQRPDSAPDGTSAERPFRNFQLPPDPGQSAEVLAHPLRIDNGSADTVMVWASAGAEPVLVQRIPPAGRFRVDLVAPRGALRIDWRSVNDRRGGSVSVEPPAAAAADSVRIVWIGPESAGPE